MRPKLYPRDIRQLSVGDARRASRFAGAASEAAIQVLGNPLRALRPLFGLYGNSLLLNQCYEWAFMSMIAAGELLFV